MPKYKLEPSLNIFLTYTIKPIKRGRGNMFFNAIASLLLEASLCASLLIAAGEKLTLYIIIGVGVVAAGILVSVLFVVLVRGIFKLLFGGSRRREKKRQQKKKAQKAKANKKKQKEREVGNTNGNEIPAMPFAQNPVPFGQIGMGQMPMMQNMGQQVMPRMAQNGIPPIAPMPQSGIPPITQMTPRPGFGQGAVPTQAQRPVQGQTQVSGIQPITQAPRAGYNQVTPPNQTQVSAKAQVPASEIPMLQKKEAVLKKEVKPAIVAEIPKVSEPAYYIPLVKTAVPDLPLLDCTMLNDENNLSGEEVNEKTTNLTDMKNVSAENNLTDENLVYKAEKIEEEIALPPIIEEEKEKAVEAKPKTEEKAVETSELPPVSGVPDIDSVLNEKIDLDKILDEPIAVETATEEPKTEVVDETKVEEVDSLKDAVIAEDKAVGAEVVVAVEQEKIEVAKEETMLPEVKDELKAEIAIEVKPEDQIDIKEEVPPKVEVVAEKIVEAPKTEVIAETKVEAIKAEEPKKEEPKAEEAQKPEEKKSKVNEFGIGPMPAVPKQNIPASFFEAPKQTKNAAKVASIEEALKMFEKK